MRKEQERDRKKKNAIRGSGRTNSPNNPNNHNNPNNPNNPNDQKKPNNPNNPNNPNIVAKISTVVVQVS